MQKLPFQFEDGLIKYEKPIAVKFQNQVKINPQPPEGKVNLRNILNILIPPKIISKQVVGITSTFVQYADEQKASRKDADDLGQKIEHFLKIRKAKVLPICPIRQEIFAQAFSQIIRQVVINCPQRGIMLSRVRNQAYLSITANRTLYQESLRFSNNKLVESQNNLSDLQRQKEQLLEKKTKLKQKQMSLLSKKQALQQKARQIRTIYKQKRQHQLHSLTIQHQGLQTFVSQIIKLKEQQQKKQNAVIKKIQQSVTKKKQTN